MPSDDSKTPFLCLRLTFISCENLWTLSNLSCRVCWLLFQEEDWDYPKKIAMFPRSPPDVVLECLLGYKKTLGPPLLLWLTQIRIWHWKWWDNLLAHHHCPVSLIQCSGCLLEDTDGFVRKRKVYIAVRYTKSLKKTTPDTTNIHYVLLLIWLWH